MCYFFTYVRRTLSFRCSRWSILIVISNTLLVFASSFTPVWFVCVDGTVAVPNRFLSCIWNDILCLQKIAFYDAFLAISRISAVMWQSRASKSYHWFFVWKHDSCSKFIWVLSTAFDANRHKYIFRQMCCASDRTIDFMMFWVEADIRQNARAIQQHLLFIRFLLLAMLVHLLRRMFVLDNMNIFTILENRCHLYYKENGVYVSKISRKFVKQVLLVIAAAGPLTLPQLAGVLDVTVDSDKFRFTIKEMQKVGVIKTYGTDGDMEWFCIPNFSDELIPLTEEELRDAVFCSSSRYHCRCDVTLRDIRRPPIPVLGQPIIHPVILGNL